MQRPGLGVIALHELRSSAVLRSYLLSCLFNEMHALQKLPVPGVMLRSCRTTACRCLRIGGRHALSDAVHQSPVHVAALRRHRCHPFWYDQEVTRFGTTRCHPFWYYSLSGDLVVLGDILCQKPHVR